MVSGDSFPSPVRMYLKLPYKELLCQLQHKKIQLLNCCDSIHSHNLSIFFSLRRSRGTTECVFFTAHGTCDLPGQSVARLLHADMLLVAD